MNETSKATDRERQDPLFRMITRKKRRIFKKSRCRRVSNLGTIYIRRMIRKSEYNKTRNTKEVFHLRDRAERRIALNGNAKSEILCIKIGLKGSLSFYLARKDFIFSFLARSKLSLSFFSPKVFQVLKNSRLNPMAKEVNNNILRQSRLYAIRSYSF